MWLFWLRIIDAAETVDKERSRRLSTAILNQVVQEALAFKSPPRTRGGRRGRIYYCTQVLDMQLKSIVFSLCDYFLLCHILFRLLQGICVLHSGIHVPLMCHLYVFSFTSQKAWYMSDLTPVTMRQLEVLWIAKAKYMYIYTHIF